MQLRSWVWPRVRALGSWARAHALLIITAGAVCMLLIIGIFDRATGAHRRDDLLFLAQMGGLIFLAVYVIATNLIAQANQRVARAAAESADAARQAAEAAVRSTQLAEAMLTEAQATRRAQESQAAPRVVVYAELEHMVIYLAIQNAGLSFASNVTVTFDPPLQQDAFPAGYMPDYFTGAEFTLRPGETIRQPLRQGYHPPFGLTGSIQQTATARYSGGILSGEAVEAFPINIRAFDKLLVTQTTEELALGKLDNLIKAVEKTGEAVTQLDSRLEDGLVVSGSILNRPGTGSADAYLTHFRKIVAGMADEWQIWEEKSDLATFVKDECWRRFRLLVEAALVTLPSLPTQDDVARHIRELLFEMQAVHAYPFLNSEFNEKVIISRNLAELAKLAAELRIEGDDDDE